MSNLNAGNQNLTFAFKHKAKGLEFNRLMHQTIVPGVYQGFTITPNAPANGKITIAPGVLWIQDNNNLDVSIRCRTFSNIILPLSGGLLANKQYWIVARFRWFSVTDNYVDFLALDSSIPFILENKDVILGKVSVNNSGLIITPVDYKDKTFGFSGDFLNTRFPRERYSKKIEVVKANDGSNLYTGSVLNNGTDTSGPIGAAIFPAAGSPGLLFELESPYAASDMSLNLPILFNMKYFMSAAEASKNIKLTLIIYRDTALLATRSITFSPDNHTLIQTISTSANDAYIAPGERLTGSVFTISLLRDNTVTNNHSGLFKLINIEAKT